MSTFKFNFSINNETKDDNEETAVPTEEIIQLDEDILSKAYEVLPEDKLIQDIDNVVVQANMYVNGDLELGYVKYEDAFMLLKENEANNSNDLLFAEKSHSDLVEGKYEGGLKIWECTNDLIEYILNNSFEFKDSTVLDLGCGMGLIGITTLSFGANVHFQDYNGEVLSSATIHNVLLNLSEENRSDIKTRCKFYAGDWGNFDSLMTESNVKYNYILTSETIYNPKNYNKVYNLIKNLLKKEGCALVAAKSHYFGIGGNTKQFEKLIIDDNVMNCETCWKSDSGLSREILKLTFKN